MSTAGAIAPPRNMRRMSSPMRGAAARRISPRQSSTARQVSASTWQPMRAARRTARSIRIGSSRIRTIGSPIVRISFRSASATPPT